MTSRAFTILSLAALGSACAPSMTIDSTVAPGASIEAGQTYSWRAGSGGVHGDPRMRNNPLLDQTVKDVIDEELQARGFRRVSSGASDLGVAYVAAVERRVDIDEVNDFLRYRRGTFLVTQTNVREINQGSLVIDFTQGASGALLLRGIAEAELHEDDREYREEKLREGVRAIIDELTSLQGQP